MQVQRLSLGELDNNECQSRFLSFPPAALIFIPPRAGEIKCRNEKFKLCISRICWYREPGDGRDIYNSIWWDRFEPRGEYVGIIVIKLWSFNKAFNLKTIGHMIFSFHEHHGIWNAHIWHELDNIDHCFTPELWAAVIRVGCLMDQS